MTSSKLTFDLTAQGQALLVTNRHDFSFGFALNSSSPGVVLDRVLVKP